MYLTQQIKNSSYGVIFLGTSIALFGLLFGITYAAGIHVDLASVPGGAAPAATGEAKIALEGTVLTGKVKAEKLPPQLFGSGHFYGVWFVRTDTGDKAFLGALANEGSIIFSDGGNGEMRFRATGFTTGPNAGSPITLGPAGVNLVVVLVEDTINGLTPSPVGGLPAAIAVAGAF
ncbi:hypothetical protein HY250_00210 [Candidatus Azambacteria bacterium]|nr:hypothetical protein [Candidatus Azambacteria bacterium]MBI3684822.1 hypothetical protein [Candidatus Azambacteria bacterium]